GAGHNNTVTQEQFQEIARQYSDIRMDRDAVHVDTRGMDDKAADKFKQGTMNDIASLMQTDSGRALLNDLQTGKNKDGSQRQTYIGGISDDDFKNNGGKGGGRYGGAKGTVDDDADHKEGFVKYRPGEVALPGNADARSDVALMHELTHADASVHDKFATGAVGTADGATQADIDGGVSRSEYQAAGMGTFATDPFNENAYRRDRAAIGASGSGMRDDEGKSDVGMPTRTTYLYPKGPSGHGGGSLGVGGDHEDAPLPGYEEG
ncbi:MAG: M91 family zinc metallopeptidase, partial [Acidobacteriota bacterium]